LFYRYFSDHENAAKTAPRNDELLEDVDHVRRHPEL
jgi:hypothetical protein